jgi:hypothetical protein
MHIFINNIHSAKFSLLYLMFKTFYMPSANLSYGEVLRTSNVFNIRNKSLICVCTKIFSTSTYNYIYMSAYYLKGEVSSIKMHYNIRCIK